MARCCLLVCLILSFIAFPVLCESEGDHIMSNVRQLEKDVDSPSAPSSPESSPVSSPTVDETASPTRSPTKRPTRKRPKKKGRPKGIVNDEECPVSYPGRRGGATCSKKLSCKYGRAVTCCTQTFYLKICRCSAGTRLKCYYLKPNCSRCRKKSRQKPTKPPKPVFECPKIYPGRTLAFVCKISFKCNYGPKTDCCGSRTYYGQKCSCFKGSKMSCYKPFVPASIFRGRCKCVTQASRKLRAERPGELAIVET